jgi:hypothetical protein
VAGLTSGAKAPKTYRFDAVLDQNASQVMMGVIVIFISRSSSSLVVVVMIMVVMVMAAMVMITRTTLMMMMSLMMMMMVMLGRMTCSPTRCRCWSRRSGATTPPSSPTDRPAQASPATSSHSDLVLHLNTVIQPAPRRRNHPRENLNGP